MRAGLWWPRPPRLSPCAPPALCHQRNAAFRASGLPHLPLVDTWPARSPHPSAIRPRAAPSPTGFSHPSVGSHSGESLFAPRRIAQEPALLIARLLVAGPHPTAPHTGSPLHLRNACPKKKKPEMPIGIPGTGSTRSLIALLWIGVRPDGGGVLLQNAGRRVPLHVAVHHQAVRALAMSRGDGEVHIAIRRR
jgi:hypothetical protein